MKATRCRTLAPDCPPSILQYSQPWKYSTHEPLFWCRHRADTQHPLAVHMDENQEWQFADGSRFVLTPHSNAPPQWKPVYKASLREMMSSAIPRRRLFASTVILGALVATPYVSHVDDPQLHTLAADAMYFGLPVLLFSVRAFQLYVKHYARLERYDHAPGPTSPRAHRFAARAEKFLARNAVGSIHNCFRGRILCLVFSSFVHMTNLHLLLNLVYSYSSTTIVTMAAALPWHCVQLTVLASLLAGVTTLYLSPHDRELGQSVVNIVGFSVIVCAALGASFVLHYE
eukprot:TRINITY_DN67396_c11_g1_i2.p1 TRINITY_DN67396_c11_g1~~TRINITY_DN67396_c11_g1_i2.p1  ORF type:complete len:286 (+),score=-2.51 TRINITY_DN67396_c11_g1_i2:49-906(+)